MKKYLDDFREKLSEICDLGKDLVKDPYFVVPAAGSVAVIESFTYGLHTNDLDKLSHGLFGLACYRLGQHLSVKTGKPEFNKLMGLGSALIFGIGYEGISYLYDELNLKNELGRLVGFQLKFGAVPDKNDVYADMLGGLSGLFFKKDK